MKKSLLIVGILAVALSACKFGEPPVQDQKRQEAIKLEKEGKTEEAAALRKEAADIDAKLAAEKAEADAAKKADAAKTGDAAKAGEAAKDAAKDVAADAKDAAKDAAKEAKADVKDAVKK